VVKSKVAVAMALPTGTTKGFTYYEVPYHGTM